MLSPNARCHWTAKARHTKTHRNQAKLVALSALGGQSAPAFSGYTLTFFFPDARRRDDDNAAAACKAYRDGIADALRVDDHTLALAGRPTIAIDRSNPRVEITLIP
jgi:hypothetical protein